MKNYFLFLLLLFLFCINAMAQIVQVNDVDAVPRIINGSFNNINVSGGIQLFLSQYNDESAAVSAPTEQGKNSIKTLIENNTLKIFQEGGNWHTNHKYVKVYVAFKMLEKLQISGACKVQVVGSIRSPLFILNITGGSNFNGGIQVNNLEMDLSGASEVKIRGSASKVSILATGASDIKGFGLITDTCNVKASGASDINISVNKEINANSTGASNIYYQGEAVINKIQKSGAGTIRKKQ